MQRLLRLGLVSVVALQLGASQSGSVYDFSLNRIDGSKESLSTYRDPGFVVLGFPANDFGGQEPGSNAQIASYCRATWSVDFPMFEKISVTGDDAHPLYEFLTSRPDPIGGEIEWNFQKFLVGRDGQIVERIPPDTQPLDSEPVK